MFLGHTVAPFDWLYCYYTKRRVSGQPLKLVSTNLYFLGSNCTAITGWQRVRICCFFCWYLACNLSWVARQLMWCWYPPQISNSGLAVDKCTIRIHSIMAIFIAKKKPTKMWARSSPDFLVSLHGSDSGYQQSQSYFIWKFRFFNWFQFWTTISNMKPAGLIVVLDIIVFKG